MSSVQEPGKKAAELGKYVERDSTSREIEHRQVVMDRRGTPLPPTQVEGHSWRRIDSPGSKEPGNEEIQRDGSTQREPKAFGIDTLRESLRQELDHLSNDQLQRVAELIAVLTGQTLPFAQEPATATKEETSAERADDFLVWASHLPQIGRDLPDEAFDRGTIYD